ncbi:MAG: BamA/TamA family outer membrane protein [Planctomycetaceae bacterium]|nr:BamA/TamA family outer membrane protein [Planctomycetaceae bacterium]
MRERPQRDRCRRKPVWRLVLSTAIATAAVAPVAFAQGDVPASGPRGYANPPFTQPTPGAAFLDLPLASVKIVGNVTIPTEEISRHVKVRPGRPVTQQQIKEDVDTLVRLRWFAVVEPSVERGENGPVLIYRVLERPIVRRVEYVGNEKIKTYKLEQLTNLKEGSPYDVAANRECARRIEEHYKEKGYFFATVELEKGNSREDREVVFRIDEGRKVAVSRVKFEGNKFFSDAILQTKKISKTRILWLFGGKYDPATVDEDLAAIEQYYHSLGFFSVKIDAEQRWTEDKARVEFVYHIDEGPRYNIRNIEFHGNNIFSEDELRQHLQFHEGEAFSGRKIGMSVQKIQDDYGELGRLFAKVDVVPRFLEEPGEVDLHVRIDEDKVWRIREFRVHIVGDSPHTRTTLVNNISQIHPGDIADPRKIRLTKSRLEGSQYFETGPQNGVRLDISRVEDDDWLVSDPVEMARGQNEREDRPVIQRNFKFGGHTAPGGTERVARPPYPPVSMETPVTPEQEFPEPTRLENAEAAVDSLPVPYTAALIEHQSIVRAQSRDPLQPPQNYIYDDSAQGDPFGAPVRAPDEFFNQPPPDFIDVDAYLTEARTGRLMFGVGVNSNNGVVGNIVFQENNFDILRPPTSWADIWNGSAWRGAGQRFRIEGMPGSQVSRYLVDWQDPYFLDSDYNLGVSGFYYQRFFEAWDEERLGGRVRVGRQLTDTVSASLAFRFENVNISDFPYYAPPILSEVGGSNFLTTFRGTISHDTRDAAFNPSEGHFVEFGVEQGVGQFVYPRLEVEGRQYFTAYSRPDGYGKHIVTARADIGWTDSGTPIFERYFAGGFQDFRGYAFRGVSPFQNGIRVGGEWRFLGGLEYSLPITANEMVRAVAFTDFGTIDEDVSLDNFRMTVGGGLRIQIPAMGPVPIALDWAVPVVKVAGDNEQLFSFYIGVNR